MKTTPAKISLGAWNDRYAVLVQKGLKEPWYGGTLQRHVTEGDLRLRSLQFDNSPAALRLWNLLLTEDIRLREAHSHGKKIVGAMKDLGTVPVLAYAAPELIAFYPDGAWWIPCVMEGSDKLFDIADRLGVDDTFCPVRAVLGAFDAKCHFPVPDLLTCSVGATCDDFSAIAQRLEHMGYPILWWEVPRRRKLDPEEPSVELPSGFAAPVSHLRLVTDELGRILGKLAGLAGHEITVEDLRSSIHISNTIRALLRELRDAVYSAPVCPLPALEMMIAEVLPLHFCSDRIETEAILCDLLDEVRGRILHGQSVLPLDAVRIFWVNPVADLRVLNLLEDCGGRVCGSDYMIAHAHISIPVDLPPLEALARAALSDPMVGTCADRAKWILRETERFGAEAIVISRIPGASHCALEGELLRYAIHRELRDIPILDIEIPSVCDAMLPTLRTRFEALVECVKRRRDAPCSARE